MSKQAKVKTKVTKSDIGGAILALFDPIDYIELSLRRYNNIKSVVKQLSVELEANLKTPKALSKGSFLYFQQTPKEFNITSKSSKAARIAFNRYYASYKRAVSFDKLFKFAHDIQEYLDLDDMSKEEMGDHTFYYYSATGGKAFREFHLEYKNEAHLKFLELVAKSTNAIKTCIVRVDAQDISNISIVSIIDAITKTITPMNPRFKMPPKLFHILKETDTDIRSQLHEIYAKYIMTNSETTLMVDMISIAHASIRESGSSPSSSSEQSEIIGEAYQILGTLRDTFEREANKKNKSEEYARIDNIFKIIDDLKEVEDIESIIGM